MYWPYILSVFSVVHTTTLRLVQIPYTLQSHGTTVTCHYLCHTHLRCLLANNVASCEVHCICTIFNYLYTQILFWIFSLSVWQKHWCLHYVSKQQWTTAVLYQDLLVFGRAKRAPHGWYICDFLLLSYVRRGLCDPLFFFSLACAVRSTKFMHSAPSLRSPHTCPACS